MFRGNSTHTYYGKGPVPLRNPIVLWKAPIGGRDGWSGTGWTGQPSVVRWPEKLRRRMFPQGNGTETEVIFGGLDGRVHFLDAKTGKQSRRSIGKPIPYSIKSSITVDPDGFPFIYFGSRKHGFWIFSLLNLNRLFDIPAGVNPATGRRMGGWPDCDGSGVIVDDYLFIGLENGWLYRVRLNRYDNGSDTGLSSTRIRDWKALDLRYCTSLGKMACRKSNGYASIESSPAVFRNRVYIANGAGMVYGINANTMKPVFQYFTGDDTDASVVVDEQGYIYVGCEIDWSKRGKGVLYKLDPLVPLKDWRKALVWKYEFRAKPHKGKKKIDDIDGGVLGTPALGATLAGVSDGRIYLTTTNVPFRSGSLIALDRLTGKVLWKKNYRSHIWSSPAVVDEVIIAADAGGGIHAYIAATGVHLWTLNLNTTIESTPVVWNGRIYVGARNGYLYCIGSKRDKFED